MEAGLHAYQVRVQRRMWDAGFIVSTVSQPANQDAMIIDCIHKDDGHKLSVTISGLDIIMWGNSVEAMERLVEARCDIALNSGVVASGARVWQQADAASVEIVSIEHDQEVADMINAALDRAVGDLYPDVFPVSAAVDAIHAARRHPLRFIQPIS